MSPETWWAIAFGAVVGVSLGLTGGGGSIFAVPLLIYGLGAGVREAVGMSLVTVGLTALFGAWLRMRRRLVEFHTGLLFAAAGMLGAPIGTWIGGRMPDAVTLGGFALLMLIVGWRMWRGPRRGPGDAAAAGSGCAREENGELRLTSKCVAVLGGAGLAVGVLTGIFGVGGGFIIVPALILVSGMPIHRAIATSLMVIAVICAAGVISYLVGGGTIPLGVTSWFVAGGIAGMMAGHRLSTRIGGPALNRVFAGAMWLVAGFVLLRTFYWEA